MRFLACDVEDMSVVCVLCCVCSMQSVQNLGLATVSLAAGKIVDAKGYLLLEVFFLAWLCGK